MHLELCAVGNFCPCPNAYRHTRRHWSGRNPTGHRQQCRVHRHGSRKRNATRLARYDGRQYTRTRGYRWWGNRRSSAPRRNGRRWHHNSGTHSPNAQPSTQSSTPFKECGSGSSSDESSRSKGGHRCRCAQYFYLKDSANNVACHRQIYCNTLLSFWRRRWEYFAEVPTAARFCCANALQSRLG